jgi:hypothetical protein
MERECFLTVLVAFLGGIMILSCGWWPLAYANETSARRLEWIRWKRVWMPLVPASIVAAWLCGWALAEPDPTPERASILLTLASIPFALVFGRAAIRAGWSLVRDEGDLGIATVGLLRPWIVFSPHLAKALEDHAIEAALEHERAHARHWDPLRMWLAQLATDLQWPWPQAQDRFAQWMLALELARDEEARAAGVDGSDLASAILASARFRHNVTPFSSAALNGEPLAIKERIARLLAALPDDSEETNTSVRLLVSALATSLLLSIALGSVLGERTICALLRVMA